LFNAALAELLLQTSSFEYLAKQNSFTEDSFILFAAHKEEPTKGITLSLDLVFSVLWD
jgi:hypothetical protein